MTVPAGRLEGEVSDSVCEVSSTEVETQSPGLGAESHGVKLTPTLSCRRSGPIQGSGTELATGAE